jgi:hypothetical protein
MAHNKSKKESSIAAFNGLMKEMAKPRMARSAAIAELNLDTSRIPDQPSVVMPGTVKNIIPPTRPSQPERAQITVKGADRRYQELRISNTLMDENGDEVKLKKGGQVEITVTSAG